MKKFSRIAGTLAGAAGLVAAGTVAATPAQAAPARVVAQIPATAFSVSGLVVPGFEFVSVYAEQKAPGQVIMSAPARPEMCSASAGGALVRIDYLNVSNGRAGNATVKPCTHFIGGTPTTATLHSGPGELVMSIRVIGSAAYPNAGQPALPGGATLTVR